MHHTKFVKSGVLAVLGVALGFFIGFADHGDEPFINVAAGAPAPSVDVVVHADPGGGYNVQLITSNFQFTGPFVNTAPVANEGHGHLFVDGEQVARLYSDWFFIGDLHEGLHEIRATLNANNHLPWAVDGEIVQAVAILSIEAESDEHGHGHDESPGGGHATTFEVTTQNPAGFPGPEVRLQVFQDAAKGWNLNLMTSNFNFAPERVSTAHIFNEGHAHVYVDGVKLNRIYSNWFNIGNLEPGGHTIEVRLSTNDHREYTRNGTLIASSVSVFETRVPDASHHGDDEPAHGEPGHDDSDGHHDDDEEEEEHQDDEDEDDDDEG